MNEIGIDLSEKVARRAEELTNDEFDYVIRLGDSPSSHHLKFQGAETIHWRVDGLVPSSNDPEREIHDFVTNIRRE